MNESRREGMLKKWEIVTSGRKSEPGLRLVCSQGDEISVNRYLGNVICNRIAQAIADCMNELERYRNIHSREKCSKWDMDDSGDSIKVVGDDMVFILDPSHPDSESKWLARQLVADLNELEAYRALGTPEDLAAILDERRWRVIGEEWPESGQECQLSTLECTLYEYLNFNPKEFSWGEDVHGDWVVGPSGKGTSCGEKTDFVFTHWRPAPTDTPTPVAVKEEG